MKSSRSRPICLFLFTRYRLKIWLIWSIHVNKFLVHLILSDVFFSSHWFQYDATVPSSNCDKRLLKFIYTHSVILSLIEIFYWILEIATIWTMINFEFLFGKIQWNVIQEKITLSQIMEKVELFRGKSTLEKFLRFSKDHKGGISKDHIYNC